MTSLAGQQDFVPGTCARQLLEQSLSAVRAEVSAVSSDECLNFSRSFISTAVARYWNEVHRLSGRSNHVLPDLPSDIDIGLIAGPADELANSIGLAAADLDVVEASYLIGVLYTGMMPGPHRAKFGAYYTPPALCERLLDMATEAGIDWRTARVLDPACGGGAFLSPVARRMADSLKDCNPTIAIKNILSRIQGFEIDPFAAWMSRVFLHLTLESLFFTTDERIPSIVKVCDSLKQVPSESGFDLVIGNPPYGRITLSPEMRDTYRRSLFGHANLYGVFTDLALRFTRPGGVVAYVTPTSFLAGEYFKALRNLLGREAPPASIDFIDERKGVFADVLQETLLAAYRRGGDPASGKVHFISPSPDGSFKTTPAGSFNLPTTLEQPWLMPRTKAQSALVRMVRDLPFRLSDYGYTVSTGPLVWNRHKTSLRDRADRGRYPLIWAESVRSDGFFEFRAHKRNHKPFFEPQAKEHWVVTDFPCVLLQRTTAKEQSRRLIAAELPVSFIQEHGAVVIENHLNMVKPISSVPKVSPAALAALLNSDVVDQVFRCISGSVAVSAYELEALPLPPPEKMKQIHYLVRCKANRETLERAIERLYWGEAA